MPDYMFMLESRLSPEQRAALLRVQELAAAIGANVYLTGGTVRDLISGASLRDLDFAVEGNPSRIARELEKGGAKVLSEDERLRQIEVIFAGDCDGSLSAARDDVYPRPGAKPETHWSTIMEDLRRRDFSVNAIAISLNSASRGLLLDPTNGLGDLEKREIRALSIHSFTNQPVRLLRALRYAARLDFKLESRTAEWFALAMERDLHHGITPEEAATELRNVAREERPAPVLKAWEARGLIEVIHPQLARRHPDYEAIARLVQVRGGLIAEGLRPRIAGPMAAAILGHLRPREQGAALSRMGFRQIELEEILHVGRNAEKAAKALAGARTTAPIDGFRFIEKLSAGQVACILAKSSNSRAIARIRTYLRKWRPIRLALPGVVVELERLGVPRGPKFDSVVEDLFALQLSGKGRTPEERVRLLRKLAGIKEPPKKKVKEEKKKPVKGREKKAAHAAILAAQEKKGNGSPASKTRTAAGGRHKPAKNPTAKGTGKSGHGPAKRKR